MNRWRIPDWLEREVISRDRECIYCRVTFWPFPEERRARPTWEHIVNDSRIINRENIARCCASCNASKGAKELAAWLESKYCQRRGITRESIAEVARAALVNRPSEGTAAPNHSFKADGPDGPRS